MRFYIEAARQSFQKAGAGVSSVGSFGQELEEGKRCPTIMEVDGMTPSKTEDYVLTPLQKACKTSQVHPKQL